MPGTTISVDGVDVTWINHASVAVEGGVRVYVDPWSDALTGDEEPADLILVTHPHHDHFDPDAINQLSHEDTFVVLRGCDPADIEADNEVVAPGHHDTHHGVDVKVVPAYNDHRFRSENVPYHPEEECAGYVFTVDGVTFYHAGDTDYINEMDGLDVDVAFLPIGGTYTMDQDEAAVAAESMDADIIIPIHYNFIDGTEADPQRFKKTVEERTESRVHLL